MDRAISRLFKYTDLSGAKKTLENSTILFSSSRLLNDPFDVAIDDLFAFNPVEALQEIQAEFNRIICSSFSWPSVSRSQTAQKAALLNNFVLRIPIESRAKLLSTYDESVWNKESLKELDREQLEKFKVVFSTEGIFSCSSRYDNSLLWSHYADDQKGVVFEFTPNLEKDSLLRLAKPVQYTPIRPILFESPRDFVEKMLFHESEDILKEYSERIAMTKSPEWEREEELRICIPMFVNTLNGDLSRTYVFHNEELRTIYLGCRMPAAEKTDLIELAKNQFPNATIRELLQDTRQYRLNDVAVCS